MRLFLILAVLLSFLPSPARAADRLEKWAQGAVQWIASRKEKEAFRALKTVEERRHFIELFWKRRDPTPGTPRNEYKEQYYQRLKFVNQRFREGVAGWRTDRGRIYLIHGPPDQKEFRTLPSSGIPGSRRLRDSIIWTYFQLPGARYFQGRIVLVFQTNIGLTEQDYTLASSRVGLSKARNLYRRSGVRPSELIDTAVRYRLVAAGPPQVFESRGEDIPTSGIGDFARYLGDLLRSPGEALEEADRERERQRESRQALLQQIGTTVSYGAIPVTMSVQDFYSGDRATATVVWQLPVSAIRFQKTEGHQVAKVDVAAQVRAADGQLVDSFFKTVEFDFTQDQLKRARDENLHYINEFHLGPGEYQVTSIVKDVQSGKSGWASRHVKCQELSREKVALSGLVLSRSLTRPDNSPLGRDLLVEKWQVIPAADPSFSKQDKMVLFFKVYNSRSIEGSLQLLVSYDVFLAGHPVYSSGLKRVSHYTDAGNRSVAYSSVVDLADFESGDYQLQVNAIDYNSQTYAIARANFRVK